MAGTYRIDFEKSRAALKERLLRLMPGSGSYPTAVQGFTLHRYNSGDDPKPYFYEPVIIVVVQGRKQVRIGTETIPYGEHSCFIAGVNMPVSGCVMEASEDTPFLSMALNLDKGLLADLAAQAPPSLIRGGAEAAAGAVVQEISPELLDAFLRLLEAAETPEQALVLGDLACREIHYRLLASPFGRYLRLLNTFGSQSSRINQAIAWLQDNYTAPLQVDELAGRLHMATSTFHKHFKEITTLSPLQYQKRLRLSAAQRLMLSDRYDVTRAAFAVGYESPTQFNREYKRLFGEAPRKDVLRMRRALAGEASGPATV